jgi:hypothetical protein
MDREHDIIRAARRQGSSMAPGPAHGPSAVRRSRTPIAASRGDTFAAALPLDALDERIAIVGTAGSGKTYAAKGFVERFLETGAHVTIVDPLAVWWPLEFRHRRLAQQWPDRNRRTTLPNRDTLL